MRRQFQKKKEAGERKGVGERKREREFGCFWAAWALQASSNCTDRVSLRKGAQTIVSLPAIQGYRQTVGVMGGRINFPGEAAPILPEPQGKEAAVSHKQPSPRAAGKGMREEEKVGQRRLWTEFTFQVKHFTLSIYAYRYTYTRVFIFIQICNIYIRLYILQYILPFLMYDNWKMCVIYLKLSLTWMSYIFRC